MFRIFTGDFETLAIWTNIKVKLAGAGPGGSYYPDFKDFTVLEIRQHMSIYILNGLSPSPRLEMKFNTPLQVQWHAVVNHIMRQL